MTSRVSVTLRPAVPADADGIAAIFVQSAAHHAQLEPGRYWVPAVEALAARYRDESLASNTLNRSTTIVAERDGEIVGFVDARLDRSSDPTHRDLNYCHVVELAVDSQHRSRGVGGALLRAAEDWGRAHGAAFAYLEYLVGNVRAGEFYERRMGYRVASLAAIRDL